MILLAAIYMKITLQSNNDYTDLKNKLSTLLKQYSYKKHKTKNHRRAAVMILLMNKNDGPHILLTKRTHKVSTHKGQISLPGGTYDKEDKEIITTAFRETWEEIGIPRNDIELLGRFDDFISIFGFHIACFIGSISYPYNYNFNQDEIDDYVEAPINIFINKEYDYTTQYFEGDQKKYIYHYYYEGKEIWGLTARILTDFGTYLYSNLSR